MELRRGWKNRPQPDFSSKEEAIRAIRAKIAELEHQDAAIKNP